MQTDSKNRQGNEANRLLCPRADLKFIIFHRPTKTEIQMPVLSICEEYSSVSFSTSENDYEGKYSGIGRLPSYVGNGSADDYDVYVEINGVRHLYDGIFYSNYKEVRRQFYKIKNIMGTEITTKQPSLFNWGEVSRTLANTRSAITESGRGHKKHNKAIRELETFELLWKERFGKKK